MSVATLPSEPRNLSHGAARIVFRHDGAKTRLADLYHHDPLRVVFPNPAPGEPVSAVLVTTSGGLVGGDRLDIAATVEAGAAAMVMAQAAEKVYRSAGADSRIGVDLAAGADAWLEYLPQETILFENSRLRRRTEIDADTTARVLAGELLVFGRIARGERMSGGLIRDSWQVRRGGRLVWADALHMADDIAGILAQPAGFDGAVACATVVYVAGDAPDLLAFSRERLGADGDGLRAGATVVNGVLVARWIGRDAFTLRRAFGNFWMAFRQRAAGLPAALPRLWHM
jgi:urease accessory protein